MYMTPRQPVKRRLVFTPMTPKRPRPAPVAVRAFTSTNKHYGKGPRKTGTLTQQVKSLQRFVNTLKPEVKYHEVGISGTNITTTGSVFHLSNIAQGDTVATRTGNSILVTDLVVKGSFSSYTGSAAVSFRIAIVVDKQQIADTSPSAGDIFTDAVATANPVTAVPSVATAERFRILWMSKLYNGGALANTANTQIPFYEVAKKMNLKVSFNGTASTDIEKNGIYFVFLTDDGANTVDYNGLCRIAFTDA